MGGHGRRAGRTARNRRRKHESTIQSVSLCHQLQYVRLAKFLHQRGFTSTLLQPALFTDTGRGLQTLQTIKPGETIISLPESCLITSATVLASDLGQLIKRWKPRLSPLLAICVFLVCERHRGEASDWFPYIGVLPDTYTCPAYFPDEVMAVLPAGVQRRAVEQREAVCEMHSSSQDFFRFLTMYATYLQLQSPNVRSQDGFLQSSVWNIRLSELPSLRLSLQPILSQPTEDVLTYEALRWAWCSVNTRSVFMSRPSNNFLSGQDNYALAPFLDLLNHRPDVQVKASFNDVTRCYEIRSVSGALRFQQAFINYGSHDNQRLLLEYGFVAADNPHSVVYVDTDLLCDVLRGDKSLDQKMKFLRENDFLHNLTVSSEGPSWRLMTALRLLSLPQTLYHQWRAALLGQAVCEETENRSIQTAKTLCLRLQQNTHRALDEISHLLQACEQPIREQLLTVRSLRQEERCILGSCLETLGGSLKQNDDLSSCQPNVGDVS